MNVPGPLSHIALVAGNAVRTADFFKVRFDATVKPQDDADDFVEILMKMGDAQFVLVQANVERPLLGDHIAFAVSTEQLHQCRARLDALGHAYQMARKDTALYFTDFDNHVFELECA
ncbi:MAG TPA: hypothetical protein VF269_01315 [Rhodanobacteraceae bacterium]